jgi:hypothetical protein
MLHLEWGAADHLASCDLQPARIALLAAIRVTQAGS